MSPTLLPTGDKSGQTGISSETGSVWWGSTLFVTITKTRLSKYIENFTFQNWKFSDKKTDIFHISAKNIDCGYLLELPHRGGSNKYPQSMFLSRNKKIMYTPVKPGFTI